MRALLQHKRLSVSSQPQIFQCSICKNGQIDARCKPLDELMMMMMTTTRNQHLRISVICDLQLSLGRFFSTPSLRIKIADTQGEWSCVALYLEIGQDNGCCHRSWQATKCNFCRILHSGSTLQSRSSAAAPSSQSHPFANFFSPKNRTARQQDDRPHSTLRHRSFHRRGVLSRREDITELKLKIKHPNPQHICSSYFIYYDSCPDNIFKSLYCII